MPPALLHLANLLWLTTVLTALYRARRQLPRLQPVAIHLFCGAIPVLTLLTLLKTAAAPGLELHLIGLTATTLLMGARLAILAAAFSQLLLLALGELPPATLGLSGLTHAAIPIAVSASLAALLRRYLPPNPFIYTLGAGFLGGILAILAAMLATAIHLMRGTPYIYMGEEIGMSDPGYTSIEDYVDVEARNAFIELLQEGREADEAFRIVHAKARDNARTPMQWDASTGAGFTDGTPWLRPTDQAEVNVIREEACGRILPYYKRLIALRKTMPVVSEGTYEPYAPDHPDVLAYIRRHERHHLLVICSFRGHETEIDVPEDLLDAEVLISNYPAPPLRPRMQLRPYEALALLGPRVTAP